MGMRFAGWAAAGFAFPSAVGGWAIDPGQRKIGHEKLRLFECNRIAMVESDSQLYLIYLRRR